MYQNIKRNERKNVREKVSFMQKMKIFLDPNLKLQPAP